jgi:hypothetical protein
VCGLLVQGLVVAGVNELRIWVAMRLATDVEACCALLRGEPVDRARLDPAELEFMAAMSFVRMDITAIDVLEPQLRRTA